MARTQKYKREDVIEAIRSGHTPTGAANVLECHPDTIRNYAKRYKSVDKALRSERAQLVDLGETGLRSALLNRDAWAIAFTLKTIGKHLGYVERQELTGAENTEPITFVIKRRKDD